MKVILVGVNHAGTSLLRTLKRLDPKIEITAYDRNTDISFLGCGIALWVGGEFENPEGLFYANKDILEQQFGAKVFMKHEILEIDEKAKKVVVKDLDTNKVFDDTYDKLVFAGGTWPISLDVPGKDLENIYFSKIFTHAKAIHDKNNDESIKNVVVLGAGYIGIELAEAFRKAGKNVYLVDMSDRVVPRYFDKEFTDDLEESMKSTGVHFCPNEKVVNFEGVNGKVSKVVTDKNSYPADLVIMSVGFKPRTDILKGKVEMIPNGAIIVDEHQISSDKDIYAIGDACALNHHVLGKAHVALATNAVKTGIVAAFHLAGNNNIKFPGVNGTNAISVFGHKMASTGISEEMAKYMKINYKSSFVKEKDKPEFMHNAEDVLFKIVYDPTTLRLLGSQISSKGIENHTEVMYAMSIAISKQMTLPEIALMDVYFLPHFNKPFNFIIQAILKAIELKY